MTRHNDCTDGRGGKLFSFAVIADSHLEPESAGLLVPRSNARNRSVVDWLRPLAPRFVLHLGDIVHPVPEAPQHDSTLDLARALYAPFDCPVLYTPGNHDIGDKLDETAPASALTTEWLGGYQRVFGAQFATHREGDCLVLLINSPLLNSGLALEVTQRHWLESELAAAAGKRVFIATHYPPYLVRPDEATSYDNIDLPARYWLLGLLERHKVEAVFCGHVHNMFYNRLGATEIHALPSTSFVRRDYSEMVRGASPDEFGRNDTGKLGFFWVDVYQSGHVARFVQTMGGTGPLADLIIPGHPKDPGEVPLGVYLRHPWCELTELPHNPPVDEFARRVVRNDYAIQALWSAGVRALRAPIQDLQDERVRARIADMVALGHRFTFFSVGLPAPQWLELLRRHAALVARWECVLPLRQADALAALAAPLVRDTGVNLALANLRSGTEGNTQKAPGKHFAAPGFLVAECELARALLGGPLQGMLSAVCFRIARAEPLPAALAALESFARATGTVVVATRALMPESPNDTALDEVENAALVEEALAAARAHPGVELVLDTFMDVDRGYYVRTGLIDRACNWRLAGRVLMSARAVAAADVGRVR